jgi:hypothetical protein
MSPEWIGVIIGTATLGAPIVLITFKMGVRWAVNGTYVRKDLFSSKVESLERQLSSIETKQDQIIDVLMRDR